LRRLRVPVARTYALAEVPAAFADFAAGAVGKLAVTVVCRDSNPLNVTVFGATGRIGRLVVGPMALRLA
jgi:hypothetical protein